MIHNLTPNTDRVWVTWDMDFVPATAPAARHIHAVDTDWVDAMGGKAYPVFDAVRGSGANGRYTFPDQAADPYADGRLPRNQWVVDHDATLVGDRRPPAPGRPVHRPHADARRAHRAACSARARTTSSRPAPCRGTSR